VIPPNLFHFDIKPINAIALFLVTLPLLLIISAQQILKLLDRGTIRIFVIAGACTTRPHAY